MSAQTALRDKLAEITLSHLETGTGSLTTVIVEAFVACIGAAAIMAAMLPEKSRLDVIDGIEDTLTKLAAQRARELADGTFDKNFQWSS